MKGVGHDDKEIAVSPQNLPQMCMGCEIAFQEGEVGRFLDDNLHYRVHDRISCIRKARDHLG
jgi:hypothetical protein